jgi:hypothetical protein
MIETQKTPGNPVDDDPEPEPGCAMCSILAAQQETAWAQGDASRRTDARVRMRRHLNASH